MISFKYCKPQNPIFDMRILPPKTLISSSEKLKEMVKTMKKAGQVKEKPECLNLIYFGYPGHEILGKKARTIKNIDDRLNVYIESLKMTAAFNNLTSLSAPQAGIDICLFVMLKSLKGINSFLLDKPFFPTHYRAIINPRVLEISELKEFAWETCGSFYAVKSRIRRPVSLKVDFYNDKLELETETLEGFGARVFQHEMDHLNGKNIMNLEKNQGDMMFEEKNLKDLDTITERDERYFENMMKMDDFINNEKEKQGSKRNDVQNNNQTFPKKKKPR